MNNKYQKPNKRHPIALILENPANLSTSGFGKLLSTFLYGRSETTQRAYLRDLYSLSNYLQCDSVANCLRMLIGDGQGFANQAVLGFRNDMITRQCAPASINRRMASIRSLVKMARTIGLISWSLDVENVRSESYRDTAGPGAEAIAKVISLLE